MSQYRVDEEVVLELWEQYSERQMTLDERGRARGHKLVNYLRTFSEAELMRAAFSAQRQGEDLDWRAWRDWVIRRQASSEASPPRRSAANSGTGSRKTGRVSNARRRQPERDGEGSAQANARAPGYSGATLPHAKGKPSKHY